MNKWELGGLLILAAIVMALGGFGVYEGQTQTNQTYTIVGAVGIVIAALSCSSSIGVALSSR